MTELPNIYVTQDFPLLKEWAKIELIEGYDNPMLSVELARRLGLDHADVLRSVKRLGRGRLLDVEAQSMMGGEGFAIVRGLTPAGLREVGAWPNATDLVDGLTKALAVEQERYELAGEPEKASRVTAVIQAIRELGLDFGAKLAA